MAHRNAQLLALQNNCKRDAESYRSEFSLQWSHYQALMELFALKPDQKSPEFADMVHFLAHVSKCYKEIIQPFSQNMFQLLDKHVDVLHPHLRMQLLQALMHMRHQGLIEAEALLALCFRLFQCQDKALKATLHSFIVQDIKLANSKGRNDRLNKSVQNYMYRIIEGHHEASVKRGLSVCTELWRRQIWRDVRTVNVIASATAHKSTNIMLAALKFFLGQDLAAEQDDDTANKKTDEPEDSAAPPTKNEVYRTYHKGTPTSKKKKVRKLKRVMHTLEKGKRRGAANQADSFAALQLLHDPQTFAERLFVRLQARGVSFETRLVMMQVVSRAIGVHELQIDNFYPFMMRYLKPSQRDVVAVLASVVQACHKLVSPEVVRPLLSQLVDQFVHDKARPEVMTVGLKTVRELCIRCPLVMDEALLSDLALYKKEKDKHVKNAAKSLVSLFRELKPSMLAKKERGRAADLGKELEEFGAADFKHRVDGVELLEEAIREGKTGSESDEDEVSDEELPDQDDDNDVLEASDSEDEKDIEGEDVDGDAVQQGEECGALDQEGEMGEEEELEHAGDESDVDAEASEEEGIEGEEAGEGSEEEVSDIQEEGEPGEEQEGGAVADAVPRKTRRKKAKDTQTQKLQQQAGSLKQLKQQLHEIAAAKVTQKACSHGDGDDANAREGAAVPPEGEVEAYIPMEQNQVLTQEDFARIRKLKVKKMVEEALAKHGLKSASQRAKMKEQLYEEMQDVIDGQEAMEGASDRRLDPATLLGKRRGRADKAERMASIMEGREDREAFGSSISRKKQKAGGLTNIEKQKKKALPAMAMKQQAANRKKRQKQKNNPKHHQGRASRGAWDK